MPGARRLRMVPGMKITPGSCPYCGVINRESEAVMGMTEAPEEGCVMICETCANFSIYVGHGATRKPDEYERVTLLEDPEIACAVLQAEMDLMNSLFGGNNG